MGGFKKAILFIILILVFTLIPSASEGENTVTKFQDVPENHWAYDVVHDLRALGVTDGLGDNRFGMGLTIKRSEFVAFLVKLMDLELITPEQGSFADNMNSANWYYTYIETAIQSGIIIDDAESFRVNEPITREEMAKMIIQALGFNDLANQLNYLESPFDDVSKNKGYIALARDFGIINGVGNNKFDPNSTAKREEAAAMMIRMYQKLNSKINEIHGFYAIRSRSQVDMIESLDSVGFGWSRLEYDHEIDQVFLNTTSSNNNEYAIPTGFSEPLTLAKDNGVVTQLMVTTQNILLTNQSTEKNVSLNEYILTNPDVSNQVINEIVAKVNSTTVGDITVSFDGVVIDFENMKGEILKQSFNSFLTDLKERLIETDKKLYVAVHPERKPGQEYYNAYDYKTIGNIADKVILMAHDYYAKQLTEVDMNNGYTTTPLTPIDEIYYAIKAITDEEKGVQDTKKIWLQISFDSVQWKLKEGKVLNKYPYNPNYEAIKTRLSTGDTVISFSEKLGNSYATFFDSNDDTQNILWYEDERSIDAKIKLAKMFDMNGISLWRLGNIPNYEDTEFKKMHLDLWQKILSLKN